MPRKPRPVGRPPTAKRKKRGKAITVWATDGQYRAIRGAAAAAQQAVSAWLLAVAGREIDRAPR